MGASTVVDVVPFKIATDDGSMWRDLVDYDEDKVPELKGWNFVEEAAEYGEFYVDVWEKNGHRVCEINESLYAAGGAIQLTLFADSREALEAACDDFGYEKTSIEGPNVACMQTL
jgi:hypothetical protein